MNVKVRVIDILNSVDEGKYSNIVLNAYFNSNSVEEKEKGFMTELFYGVIRNKIFIEYIIGKFTKKVKKKWMYNLLKISIYQGFYMNSDIKGVVWEAAEVTKNKYGIEMSKFINAVLRNIFRNIDNIREELENEERYDILYSYPEWIYKKLKKEYPENFLEVMESYKKVAKMSFRVNRLKYSEVEFEEYLEKNGINILKKVDSVYYVDSGKIINTDIFRSGKVIVQDGSSYYAAKLLGAKQGEKILDCCSAPGSKAMVMAENMNNIGEITAIDIYKHKIKLIKQNKKKCGAEIVLPRLHDATKIKGEFDKILVDAPCSSIGVIRKKPETLYNKEYKNIKELAKLQEEILENVSKSLKVGGELIYSTCTIFNEENGDNIKKFLENNKEFKVEKIELDDNINYSYDEIGGIKIGYKEEFLDGFYIIKLVRGE
ncbi:16S rRNA (cytosine(967)-C(5))-methyltransferase RsmB [Haliovirga abyssi]|uniref:16S rRNA (cytosine(967)-C(5))-methyltransferase n=1 Tax=Haliovirga abyssi TaxID=2996794 RepID=A0AAU9D2H7_9FUSO|nr:16S rRNA (cytosine(967)-C(5))-methyltransferase RsmB [Haliovirga abyssi]BDU50201.1 ribosomal RNA small subunit methyltransferase B [Haliovirga abyssi]